VTSRATELPAALVEREYELARADELLALAGGGSGGVLVLEGAAGAGKTRLLQAIAARAGEQGFAVFSARGSELERDYAFGLVRQALEPALFGLGKEERAELLSGAAASAEAAIGDAPVEDTARPADPYATLAGLFWLVAALADRAPVLLCLDDLHWADEPSLRFLSFVLGRVESIPVLIAVTCRPTTGEETAALVHAVAADAGATPLRLGALGEEAVRILVADRLAADPDDSFTRACLATSGGNPFLLVELLRALAADGVSPSAANAPRVAGASPENVARSVSARLLGTGESVARFARALSVVGEGATLTLGARVAGLSESEASAAADALATIGLISSDGPLRFEHPLLRTAVEGTLAPGERLRLHAAAATLLEAAGAAPERIALHLLETEPAGDEAAARVLGDAGRSALRRGAPKPAARLLRRALEPPPPADEKMLVLFDLGLAESGLGMAEATGRFEQIVREAPDALLRGRALGELTWVTGPRPDAIGELIPLYRAVIEDVEGRDRELALGLEAARLGALFLTPGSSPSFEEEAERFRDLPGDTPSECALLAWLARKASLGGGTAAECAELAERAARHPALLDAGPGPVWVLHLILALVISERLETAEAVLGQALEKARESGSASAFATASSQRALVRHAAGDLRGCEADARAALETHGLAAIYPFQPLIPLTESLADQGKVEDGEALLGERGLGGELPGARPYTALLIARGRLRAAGGDIAAADRDLGEALVRLETARSRGVMGLDGRLEAALMRHALGDSEGAQRISETALEAAIAWQGKRALGGALRVAGLLRGGESGIEMLREAVSALADSPARLWHARALVDLGAALRRAGRRRDSRPPLREGIELAEACGAAPLAQLGRSELAASGGRLPPRAGGGVAELTPSERRVAELAADGRSNPQIAQHLFVTIKTVEMHLSNAYRKLDIGSRSELPALLYAEGPA